MFKKIFIAIGILGLSYSAFAQSIEGINARLDAMGGAGVISDIGWTIDKPCKIVGYGDQVQASGIIKEFPHLGKSYGAIIAIKSLGENMAIGLTYNDRRIMSGSYYKLLQDHYGFSGIFPSVINKEHNFLKIPHLNIGFKFSDNFLFGIGGFMESVKRDVKFNKNLEYEHDIGGGTIDTNLIKYDSTSFHKYFGIGAIVDAKVTFGAITWNPEFRLYYPKIEGKEALNRRSNMDTSHNVINDLRVANSTIDSEHKHFANNMMLRLATKFSTTIGSTFWICGVWFKSEKFEFEKITNYTSTFMSYNADNVDSSYYATFKSWKEHRKYFDWWIGCLPSFSDGWIFTPEYIGNVRVLDKYNPESGNVDSTSIQINHKVILGIEGSIKDVWFFQEILPRLGLVWKFHKWIDDYHDSEHSVDYIHPWTATSEGDPDAGKGLKVSAGLGLKAKRGCFDISFDVLEWTYGSLLGPSASIVSYTADFSRREKAQ